MNARGLVLDPAALRMRAVRGVFRTLSAVSPAIAAKAASRLWFTPPRPALPQAWRDFLATGERRELFVHGRRVVSWSWGDGDRVILFVHGWGGTAAQVQSFVAPLTQAGYRVITFDAPAHGASGASRFGEKQSTFFDFADAMMAIGRDVNVAGVIAHSGGCTAVAWAIRSGWRVPAAVFIAPMGSPIAYRTVFQSALGVSDDVMQRFSARTEERLQFKWEELEVPTVANVAETPRLLVVHDRDDRETSWNEGAAVAEAWPNAHLMTTSGLGHRKVLKDANVVTSVVEFF